MWILLIAIFSFLGILGIFLRRFFLVMPARKANLKDSLVARPFSIRKKKVKKIGLFLKIFFVFIWKIIILFLKFFLIILNKLKQIFRFFFKKIKKQKGGILKIFSKLKIKSKKQFSSDARAFDKSKKKDNQLFIQNIQEKIKHKPSSLFKKIKALQKTRNALREEQKTTNTFLKKAEIFLNLKDYYTAEKYILQAISEKPKEKDNYVFLARIYIYQNNFSDAGQCLEQAFRLGERNIDLLLLGADCFLRWRKKNQCYKIFQRAEKIAETKKTKARVFFQWGKACKIFLDSKKAKDLFEKAMRMDKN